MNPVKGVTPISKDNNIPNILPIIPLNIKVLTIIFSVSIPIVLATSSSSATALKDLPYFVYFKNKIKNMKIIKNNKIVIDCILLIYPPQIFIDSIFKVLDIVLNCEVKNICIIDTKNVYTPRDAIKNIFDLALSFRIFL